jgi:hypothetical protein
MNANRKMILDLCKEVQTEKIKKVIAKHGSNIEGTYFISDLTSFKASEIKQNVYKNTYMILNIFVKQGYLNKFKNNGHVGYFLPDHEVKKIIENLDY